MSFLIVRSCRDNCPRRSWLWYVTIIHDGRGFSSAVLQKGAIPQREAVARDLGGTTTTIFIGAIITLGERAQGEE